ncbi:MAG: VWA domain-containing protein [Deltaproteobacteria bacterium]|nr:VWA domain-containing protein [Deltaproteobacteria bacterium]
MKKSWYLKHSDRLFFTPLGWFCLFLLSGFLFSTPLVRAEGIPQVMFIFDASGSMWGTAGDQTKIEAAKEVMAKIVPELPSEVKAGLTVYGHRKKGDCSDIEVLVGPGEGDRDALLAQLKAITPKGKTPMADSIKMVADRLKGVEEETMIILISDGEETCHADPCGVVKSLKKLDIKFVLHVVGFDVNDEQKEQLTCLAEAGGGRYFGATDTDSLLGALETVKQDVAQKVEKAKTTTRKTVTKLGKLQVTLPESARRCLHTLKIIRVSDGKMLKKVEDPKADATHPLLAGKYEIIAGYANSNYKPDSEVSFGVFEVKGGETTSLNMGAMAINIADSLEKIPAGAVIITREGNEKFTLVTPYTGNSYYFYKTKPLPPGVYDFAVHYKLRDRYHTPDTPVVLGKSIEIQEGKESVVTIDSGIQLKKPQSTPLSAWELIPSGGGKAILRIEPASNGDYPLWDPYAVPPGTYDLMVFPEGMTEPLPVGEGLTIKPGELLQFDAGI